MFIICNYTEIFWVGVCAVYAVQQNVQKSGKKGTRGELVFWVLASQMQHSIVHLCGKVVKYIIIS